jgi:hypothetical protein
LSGAGLSFAYAPKARNAAVRATVDANTTFFILWSPTFDLYGANVSPLRKFHVSRRSSFLREYVSELDEPKENPAGGGSGVFQDRRRHRVAGIGKTNSLDLHEFPKT